MDRIIKLPKLDGQIQLKMSVPWKKEPIVIHVRRAFMEELVADLDSFSNDTDVDKARVSVSCDMSAKEFGNGAGVSVTISISCKQSEGRVNQAVSLLGIKTRLLAKEQLTLAGQEYNHLMKSQVAEWGELK
jgi:hypothetical protein